MKIQGSNVLITGGASGIGRLMGQMALQRGAAALIIWDINEANIQATVQELSPLGQVYAYRVDVGNVDNVHEAYLATVQECGAVDILINCAGIVTSNHTFDRVDISEIDRTIRINTIAPMYVAREMLPDMLSRNRGHICNIASAAGMLGNPRMAVYAASKWAAIGWSESIRIEMDERRSGVHVTTVAPYYINTGMFDGVRSVIPILNPAKTARKILRAIERNKNFCGMPFPFHLIRLCQGILPTCVFDWFFGQVFGVYHTMDHFTGRRN